MQIADEFVQFFLISISYNKILANLSRGDGKVVTWHGDGTFWLSDFYKLQQNSGKFVTC